MKAPAAGTGRLAYIDWMRGLAILIMIQAHTLDSWTRVADRKTLAYGISAILAGFAAPMFLFLAGVSVALGASARQRRTGDMAKAAASVRRRGWEIFGLAFLFRFQAYLLNPRAMLQGLFKVDILNIMGPSIVAAAALWQAGRSHVRRLAIFACAALLMALLTPPVRATHAVDWLPDVIEWYIHPRAGMSNFTFFPWAGFVFAGGFVGVLLDRRPANEPRFHLLLLAGSLAFTAAAYAASYGPSIHSNSSWWTTAPTFFMFRAGIIAAVLPLVYFYERRPPIFTRDPAGAQSPEPGGVRYSPMAVFGRASLFVYWVHTEMAYGFVTAPLHKALPFWTAVGAFAIFTLFMFGLTLLKNRAVRWWKERRTASTASLGN
jgi:uncharacterized membrane protein